MLRAYQRSSKYQFYSFWGLNPPSTTPEVGTLTITPPMQEMYYSRYF
jgi:hypothetical protein